MKLSDKKRSALYDAITSEILDVRVKLQQQVQLPATQDTMLAQVEHKIWRKVCKALNLQGEP